MHLKRKWLAAVCSVMMAGIVLAMESPVSLVEGDTLPEVGYLSVSYPVSYTFYNRMSQAISSVSITPTGINGTFTETSGCSALAAGASCVWSGSFTPTGSASVHQAQLVLSYWGVQVPVTQTIDATTTTPDALYLAVGSYTGSIAPAVFSSTNAATWTDSGVTVTTLSGSAEEVFFTDVAYYYGLWVASGSRYVGSDVYAARVFTSTDGVNWTERDLGYTANADALSVVHGGSQWVVVGGATVYAYGSDAPAFISTSANGQTWSTQTMPTPSGSGLESLEAVAYGDGKWVAVGYASVGSGQPLLYSSTDGINWVSRTVSADAVSLRSVIYADSKWVVTGENLSSGRKNQVVFTSTDTITWSAQTLPTDSNTRIDLSGVAYHEDANGGSHWVAVSDTTDTSSNGKILYSTDAETWVERSFPGDVTKTTLYAVSYINNRWVAVGHNRNTDHSKAIIISTDDDAETWSSIAVTPDESSTNYYIKSVASNQ